MLSWQVYCRISNEIEDSGVIDQGEYFTNNYVDDDYEDSHFEVNDKFMYE